jgi:small subunit ribosomal protein S18
MKKTQHKKIKIRPINDKCPFCDKKELFPSYKNAKELEGYITDRARIMSTARSGVCNRHQAALSREIKRARFLSLLPISEKIY